MMIHNSGVPDDKDYNDYLKSTPTCVEQGAIFQRVWSTCTVTHTTTHTFSAKTHLHQVQISS